MDLQIKILRPGGNLVKAYDTDAGFDLFYAPENPENVSTIRVVRPGDRGLFPTGVATVIPEGQRRYK